MFQEYYASFDPPLATASSISWVGTLQTFLLLAGGSATGSLVDRGQAQIMSFVGCALITLGLILTSFSGEFTDSQSPVYYQVLLSQGILSGLGMSLLLVPSTAVLSTHFTHNRALAAGLAGTGASVGGIIYPILTRRLLVSIGFSWSIRAIALVVLVTTSIGAALLRQRAELRKTQPNEHFTIYDVSKIPYTRCLLQESSSLLLESTFPTSTSAPGSMTLDSRCMVWMPTTWSASSMQAGWLAVYCLLFWPTNSDQAPYSLKHLRLFLVAR